MNTPKKETILAALYAFATQRPGLEFANYGDCKSYNSEMRGITKTLREFRQLYRQVELSGITAENLMDASRSAFSGRLQFVERGGKVAVDYTTGQYFCTEFRKAACAVLAAALWDYKRSFCMPADLGKLSPGDWLRKSFRREFGRSIQSRWFD